VFIFDGAIPDLAGSETYISFLSATWNRLSILFRVEDAFLFFHYLIMMENKL
jgi:hypothetical protein